MDRYIKIVSDGASCIALHMTMEQDARESGDILDEARAKATQLGIINGLLVAAGEDVSKAAVLLGKQYFEREMEKRRTGQGFDLSRVRDVYHHAVQDDEGSGA